MNTYYILFESWGNTETIFQPALSSIRFHHNNKKSPQLTWHRPQNSLPILLVTISTSSLGSLSWDWHSCRGPFSFFLQTCPKREYCLIGSLFPVFWGRASLWIFFSNANTLLSLLVEDYFWNCFQLSVFNYPLLWQTLTGLEFQWRFWLRRWTPCMPSTK